MLFRARPDEIQFEIMKLLFTLACARIRQVPSVYVIVAEIVYSADCSVECFKDFEGFRCECCSFCDQDALLAVNRPEYGDTAATLIYEVP